MKYVIKDKQDREKEVSKKYYEKIKGMNENIQQFFLICKDFDLNKRYPVQGCETKLKGIDILWIMDLIYKDRDDPTRNLILKNNLLYYTQQDKCVGWLSLNGFVSFPDNDINNPKK